MPFSVIIIIKLMRQILILLVVCLPFSICSQKDQNLKDKFENYFLIGATINQEDYQIIDKDSRVLKIVSEDFNSVTPENSMKWMHSHPEYSKYTFSNAEKILNYAAENDMYLLGHTLVWHNQVPPYVSEINEPDKFKLHLQNHIFQLVTRFKGKVDMWDVVNEALNDDGTLRETIFLEMLGDDYIAQAFQYANDFDPNVELAYNDYNLYKPEKRAGAIRIINSLKEKGIRIDAVGIQAHWDLHFPSIKEIEQTIIDLAKTGVDVMITELDITVIPNPYELAGIAREEFKKFEGDKKWDPYQAGIPENVQKKLTKRYRDIFELFVKHHDKISRVTFWGTTDKYTWRNHNPINNRADYPLLFDREYNKKSAYYELLDIDLSKKN